MPQKMSSASSMIWLDQVLVCRSARRHARQRDVNGVGGHLLLQQRGGELLPARLERGVHGGADGVGKLTHGRALLGRHFAHRTHDGRELALLAQVAHAQGLEGLHGLGGGQALLELGLDRLEVVGHRHRAIPSLLKNRPLAAVLLPKDGMIRGTTSVGATGCLPRAPALHAPFRGAYGFPTERAEGTVTFARAVRDRPSVQK